MNKRLFLHFGIVVFAVLALAGCENQTDSTKPLPTDPEVQVNQTPVAGDFNIGNLTQTVGNVTPVAIEPKAGKSTGTIMVFYNGSTDLPTTAGNYAVTFDVAVAEGFNTASGLAAGTLTISAASQILTPSAGDYTISGTGTFTSNSSRRSVTVTPKPGKSSGAVTVKYNGSTTAPSAVGTYTVTFDVEKAEGFNAASGLSAGTLTIKAASSGGGGGGSSGGGGGSGGGTMPQPPDPSSSSFNVNFSGPTEKAISITKSITNNLSKSNGGTITLDISENFTSYEWFVGGNKIANGKSVTLQVVNSAFVLGYNWITVVVYDGTGTPWSGEFMVVINK